MLKTNKITKSIRLALLASISSSFFVVPSAAIAAEEEKKAVERIEVTGSRIKRADIEGANPVTVIDRAAIDKIGVTNVGDLLQNLTSSAGAAANTQVNNGSENSGAIRFSLRGMGDNRTLVLLNGRRIVAGGSGANSAVDLNNIPVSIIKRVEVLKDGASSIYGSDAIAGVVNIITRNDFEGFEVQLTAGQHSEGDGAQKGFDITMGTRSDKGNVVLAIGANDQEDVFMGDRGFSEFELRAYPDGHTEEGGSSAPPWSNVDGYPGSAYDPTDPDSKPTADFNVTRGPEYGDWRKRDGSTDSYNYNPVNYLQTPSKKFYLSAFGDYFINDNVTAFAEASYVKVDSQRLIAPEPLAPLVFFGSPAPYSADNYYNMMYGPKDKDGNSYEIHDWRRRMLESGGCTDNRQSRTVRLVAGLKGTIGDEYQWEISYNYGENFFNNYATGYYHLDRVAEAVGPTHMDSDGNVQCGATADDAIDGCVPLNIFGEPGTDTEITPEMLQYISGNYNTFEEGGNKQYTWQAILSGDLFETDAGIIGFAAGLEYRKEVGTYTPDALLTNGITTAGDAVATSGFYTATEAFVEFAIPLTDTLEADAAIRFSDYDTFGKNTSGKVGLRWRPTDELMLRATTSTAFRAPSTSELFGGAATGFPEATDPCSIQNSPETSGPKWSNCVSTGVPAGFNDDGVEQIPTKEGGNANFFGGTSFDLEPEEADILTIGVVYSPESVEGLSLTVDYWAIELDNAISTIGTQSRLNACYNSGLYCDSISRFGAGSGAEGSIILVEDFTVNVGGVDTSGVDTNVRYAFETDVGEFVANLTSTYLIDYDKEIALGEVISHAGRFNVDHDGNFAEWKHNFSIDWKYGDFDTNLSVRYISSVIEEEKGWWTDPFDRDVEANTTVDLQTSYHLEDYSTKLTLGINNLLDQDPPFVYSAFGANTDVSSYDVTGRYMYVKATMKF